MVFYRRLKLKCKVDHPQDKADPVDSTVPKATAHTLAQDPTRTYFYFAIHGGRGSIE